MMGKKLNALVVILVPLQQVVVVFLWSGDLSVPAKLLIDVGNAATLGSHNHSIILSEPSVAADSSLFLGFFIITL